jgi:hypothetical protein
MVSILRNSEFLVISARQRLVEARATLDSMTKAYQQSVDKIQMSRECIQKADRLLCTIAKVWRSPGDN